MRREYERWSEETVARLRKRAKDGATPSEIARELGCSRNAVLGKADRLSISFAGTNPQRHAERSARKNVPRDQITSSQRHVFGVPSQPRRFSWQETLDTPAEPA